MSPEFDKLDALVRRIDELPELQTYYYVDDNEECWLRARMIASGGLNAPTEVKELMLEFAREVQRLLVDEAGQHSGFFWALQMNGYRTLVAGRERKNSMFSALVTPYKKWQMSYG